MFPVRLVGVCVCYNSGDLHKPASTHSVLLAAFSNEVLFSRSHAMLHAGMRATCPGHKWCVACFRVRRRQPRCLAPLCTNFAVRQKQGFCSLHWIFPPGQKAAKTEAQRTAEVVDAVAIWAPASCSSAGWVLAYAPLSTPSPEGPEVPKAWNRVRLPRLPRRWTLDRDTVGWLGRDCLSVQNQWFSYCASRFSRTGQRDCRAARPQPVAQNQTAEASARLDEIGRRSAPHTPSVSLWGRAWDREQSYIFRLLTWYCFCRHRTQTNNGLGDIQGARRALAARAACFAALGCGCATPRSRAAHAPLFASV